MNLVSCTSDINGAYWALKKCMERAKAEITYYLGYKINFVELHPKTGETRDTDNKALQFFHNRCDAACRDMADICRKDYKAFTTNGSKDGKTLAKLQEESKPKPKNPRGNYNSYRGGRH